MAPSLNNWRNEIVHQCPTVLHSIPIPNSNISTPLHCNCNLQFPASDALSFCKGGRSSDLYVAAKFVADREIWAAKRGHIESSGEGIRPKIQYQGMAAEPINQCWEIYSSLALFRLLVISLAGPLSFLLFALHSLILHVPRLEHQAVSYSEMRPGIRPFSCKCLQGWWNPALLFSDFMLYEHSR